MRATAKTLKSVLSVRKAPPRHWVGDGFHVHSMFTYDSAELSPFLLLDYAPPTTFAPSKGKPRGVGEHPHRGFETVSIALQGEIEHRDSTGSHGKLGPGDVQWMTAASGIVHEEKHGREFTRKGGVMHFVQLWVNLPARFKMSSPRYQDILARQIPNVELPGGAGTVRVIAGDYRGTKGAASTFTPVDLWDLRLESGRGVELSLPEGHVAAVLVARGAVRLNGSPQVNETELAVLERGGERFSIEATEDAIALVLSGEPIDEPIAAYGPFVMNTEEEIRQAMQDYQSGKMGHLDA